MKSSKKRFFAVLALLGTILQPMATFTGNTCGKPSNRIAPAPAAPAVPAAATPAKRAASPASVVGWHAAGAAIAAAPVAPVPPLPPVAVPAGAGSDLTDIGLESDRDVARTLISSTDMKEIKFINGVEHHKFLELCQSKDGKPEVIYMWRPVTTPRSVARLNAPASHSGSRRSISSEHATTTESVNHQTTELMSLAVRTDTPGRSFKVTLHEERAAVGASPASHPKGLSALGGGLRAHRPGPQSAALAASAAGAAPAKVLREKRPAALPAPAAAPASPLEPLAEGAAAGDSAELAATVAENAKKAS